MKWLRKIVVPLITPQWEEIADQLLIPYQSQETFKTDCKADAKGCCVKMLKAWVNTNIGVSPKTWNTLVTAISAVDELQRATEEIKEQLTIYCDHICSDLQYV